MLSNINSQKISNFQKQMDKSLRCCKKSISFNSIHSLAMEDSEKLFPHMKKIRRENNGCQKSNELITWANYKSLMILGGAMSVTVLISVIISTVYLENKLAHLKREQIEKVEKNVFQRLEIVSKQMRDTDKEVRKI